MTALLLGHPDVRDVVNSGGLVGPGNSVTQRVSTRGGCDNVSFAAMLIPTNHGFFRGERCERTKRQATIPLTIFRRKVA